MQPRSVSDAETEQPSCLRARQLSADANGFLERYRQIGRRIPALPNTDDLAACHGTGELPARPPIGEQLMGGGNVATADVFEEGHPSSVPRVRGRARSSDEVCGLLPPWCEMQEKRR